MISVPVRIGVGDVRLAARAKANVMAAMDANRVASLGPRRVEAAVRRDAEGTTIVREGVVNGRDGGG